MKSSGGMRKNRIADSVLRKVGATGVTAAVLLVCFISTSPVASASSGTTGTGIGSSASIGATGLPSDSDTTIPTPPTISQSDADSEAALVASEDRRLIEIRAAISAARSHGTEWESPFRLATVTGYTLVLTPRTAPYTVADLLQLAPDTFLEQSDGSYLLTESIFVELGATLDLSAPGGLVLKMASNSSGFVSIISFGGGLEFSGTAGNPMKITSWDPVTDTPDTDVADGRAYIRTIGGTYAMSYVNVSDLGFWSGRTGGIGLTGTDRPAVGSTGGPFVYSGAHGKTAQKIQQLEKAPTGPAKSSDNLGANGVTSQPAGALGTPDSQFSVPGLSYVSVDIDHTNISGDAFGLFVSGATGIQISNVNVTGSLVTGIDLHRYASEGLLSDVTSDNNDGDGIVISRAADQIQIEDSVAEYNAGNGFTVNGQPISQGASASGEPLDSYGNNTITASTSEYNEHYGFEVLGGLNDSITDNSVVGNDMGIVVRRAAQRIVIVGNVLTDQDREGISIQDGVAAATVSANVIQGAVTGIYIRGSSAQVVGNTISGATIHGVTLVGNDSGTQIHTNTLSGSGPDAINVNRQTGQVSIGGNQTSTWIDTTAIWKRIKSLIRPLTIIWFCIFMLIVLAAFREWRVRHGKGTRHVTNRKHQELGAHPYGKQAALPTTSLEVIILQRDANGINEKVAVTL